MSEDKRDLLLRPFIAAPKFNFRPYSRIDVHPLTFREECVIAAKCVNKKNDTQMPIAVMFSGGIDSEVVVQSFLLAEIPFTVIIGKLIVKTITGDIVMNMHDIQYAERWCVDHDVQYVYCLIDIYAEASILYKYALESESFSPQYAVQMYMMYWANKLGYFFVAGNGEMTIVRHEESYVFVEEEREQSLVKFIARHNLQGEPMFGRVRTEQIVAFLQMPRVCELMLNNKHAILDSKYYVYSEQFDLHHRPKYTGFERLQEWDSILRTELKKFNEFYDRVHYTPIHEFLKYLRQ